MWYLIALISGFSFATADAFTKKESKSISAIVLAWIREAYALPFLLPILLFIEIPDLDRIFWFSIISLVLLDLLTTVLYMKAIQIAPLSLTIPYQGLTPIFLLIFPTIFLGETLSLLGIVGVVVISIGAYTLQLDRVKYGFLEPWVAIFKNRGSLYMFIVAVLYAVTATLGKLAIQHSSPLFMTTVYFSLLAIGFTPFAILSCKGNLKQLVLHPSGYFKIGISMAVMAITHFTAISMIQVAYMISIKRLSLLFAILYGWWWFKEENIKERLLGGIIILIGATCIAFA